MPGKALPRPVIAVADARRVDGARQAVTGRLGFPTVSGTWTFLLAAYHRG